MADTHVFSAHTDEPPGPIYMCIPFNGFDKELHRFFITLADSLPKHWHWSITRIYTVAQMEEVVTRFVDIRKANNLDV